MMRVRIAKSSGMRVEVMVGGEAVGASGAPSFGDLTIA